MAEEAKITRVEISEETKKLPKGDVARLIKKAEATLGTPINLF
jgi:hypothetical protein